MKHLTLYIFMVVFVANTTVASAWVLPCLQDNTSGSIEFVDISNVDGKPCHDDQKQDQNMQCEDEGACLCLHMLMVQVPIINTAGLSLPHKLAYRFNINNDASTSVTLSPLYRPPIFLS